MDLPDKGPEAGRELDAEVGELLFDPIGRNEPKYYSTNMEDAFAVLYKLHELGWFWRLDSVHGGVICTVQCLIGDPKKTANPERKTIQVGAATIPVAICTAAIKTRVKKDQN